jgi:hypothetical protein
MLDAVKLGPANKMKFRKEAVQYTSTMAKISINDSISLDEKVFWIPLPKIPEHFVDFNRVGYVTYANVLKSKYKPRAFKCFMVGYAMNHSPHMYKVFEYEPGKPGEIIVTRNVRW